VINLRYALESSPPKGLSPAYASSPPRGSSPKGSKGPPFAFNFFMDDDEIDISLGVGGAGQNTQEDLSLPKATMSKLIQELLPDDIAIGRETKDLFTDCCVEFIHLISSGGCIVNVANEVCEKESKKTIAGEHVVAALKNFGYDDYIPQMEAMMQEHLKTVKVRFLI
jgi:histone H3/H4